MNKNEIGSMAWFRESGGNLTIKSKLSLLSKVLVPSMSGFLKTTAHIGRKKRVSFEEIPFPDSAAVKIALEEIESCASAGVLQHSFRTYFWGAGLGHADNLKFDSEFLLVSSLLHDLGMTQKHRNGDCSCFAADSAVAAAKTMEGSGWGADKLESLSDAICLHMNGHVDLSQGAEAHLLQQATAYDIVGSRYYDLHSKYRETVLHKHPRENINRDFAEFIANERARHPKSRAALMHDVGLPLMIKFNPYSE